MKYSVICEWCQWEKCIKVEQANLGDEKISRTTTLVWFCNDTRIPVGERCCTKFFLIKVTEISEDTSGWRRRPNHTYMHTNLLLVMWNTENMPKSHSHYERTGKHTSFGKLRFIQVESLDEKAIAILCCIYFLNTEQWIHAHKNTFLSLSVCLSDFLSLGTPALLCH